MRAMMRCFISDVSLSLTALSVRVQYINILHGTSVFNDYYKAVISNDNLAITENIAKWKVIAHHERFKPRALDEVIKDYKSQSDVKYPLPESELEKIHVQYKSISSYRDKLQLISPDVLLADIKLRLSKYEPKVGSPFIDDIKEEDELYILAVLRELYKQAYGIFPYNLQMLNCLALMKRNKAVTQVKTGEGKSTIITLLAAYLALKGHKVDIITTSKDLAMRDAEKFQKFYDMINLQCGHIEYKRVGFQHLMPNIIYGQITSFEFVHLFGLSKMKFDRVADVGRDYDVVLVDEADSMFLDTALSGARISIPDKSSPVEHFKWIWDYADNNSYMTVDGLRDYLQQQLPEDSDWSYGIEELTWWLNSASSAKKQATRCWLCDSTQC